MTIFHDYTSFCVAVVCFAVIYLKSCVAVYKGFSCLNFFQLLGFEEPNEFHTTLVELIFVRKSQFEVQYVL